MNVHNKAPVFFILEIQLQFELNSMLIQLQFELKTVGDQPRQATLAFVPISSLPIFLLSTAIPFQRMLSPPSGCSPLQIIKL
jgi:hypothetical protein